MVYTKEQIKVYLDRIKYSGSTQVNGHTLERLQEAHLHHIPYENLDLLEGREVSLAAQDLFNKIILMERGGYCYELNALFGYLLESLGFTVKHVAARFINEDQTPGMRTHHVLMVETVSGYYLCDVGLSNEGPRKALPIDGRYELEDGCCQYEFTQDEFLGHVLWQKKQKEAWKQLYAFTEEEQLEMDYQPYNVYCCLGRDSFFNKTRRLALFTNNGLVTLRDCTLRLYQNGTLEKEVLMPEEAIPTVIGDYFGIAKR